MGQVSADQEVPEVAAVCLEAPGHSDSVSCGFPGTQAAWLPRLISFILSRLLSYPILWEAFGFHLPPK